MKKIGKNIGYEKGCLEENVKELIKEMRKMNGERRRKEKLKRRGMMKGGGGEWRERIEIGRIWIEGKRIEVRDLKNGEDGKGMLEVIDIEI